jgi:hypothetical protein
LAGAEVEDFVTFLDYRREGENTHSATVCMRREGLDRRIASLSVSSGLFSHEGSTAQQTEDGGWKGEMG